jgi:hypothetical protein
MVRNKIALIQVWLGQLPEYFEYHFESIRKLKQIDFIFFTDQSVQFESDNFHVKHINKDLLQDLFYEKTKTKIDLKNQNYKVCDLKASYGHLFEDFLVDYSFFGVYDIDTIFGDLNKFIDPYLSEFDIISFGGKEYHNRISGPLIIFKNVLELKTAYQSDEFFTMLQNSEVVSFEEHYFFQNIIKNKFKYKILTGVSGFIEKNGFYEEYESVWKDGKLLIDGDEKMILHFYHKKNVDFIINDGVIKSYTKECILHDFYWVTYCTKSYEYLLINLLKSVKNYSNRRIIVYTINYNFDLDKYYQYKNSQFEFIRYDMEEGSKDELGRDFNISSFKPKICLEITKKLPKDKFIFIDTDIHFTTNSDDLSKFLPKIKHYPLFNSHVHDIIYMPNVIEEEPWSDTVGLILKEVNINQSRLFPRRKANVFLFDKNCDWYFKEQINLFETLKDKNKLFLLKVYDEDLANVIVTKYGLTESLPLVDIEESYDLSLHKIQDYSYSMTSISPNVTLPQNLNDIYFFHGFKKIEDYHKIEEIYGNTILKKNDILFIYEKNTLSFIRNNFLYGKNIHNSVSFFLLDKFDREIGRLSNQNLFNYICFYISDLILSPDVYKLRIIEDQSQKIIYNNVFHIS